MPFLSQLEALLLPRLRESTSQQMLGIMDEAKYAEFPRVCDCGVGQQPDPSVR